MIEFLLNMLTGLPHQFGKLVFDGHTPCPPRLRGDGLPGGVYRSSSNLGAQADGASPVTGVKYVFAGGPT